MEDVRSMLIEREKEKRAMHQRIKELKDHTNQLEEEVRAKLNTLMCSSVGNMDRNVGLGF